MFEHSRPATRHSWHVRWSDEDREWVGTCDTYPSLSWLSGTEDGAWVGIRYLVTAEEDKCYE